MNGPAKAWLLPLIPLWICSASTATTINVPSEQPTIQAGIDAASYGDTVLVACDTYYEHGILMKSGVHLLSETGDPDCVTIDAEEQTFVVKCNAVDANSSIRGFTLTRGTVSGLLCTSSSVALEECRFTLNSCPYFGGGAYCYGSSCSPTFTSCIFSDNYADDDGGGLSCPNSTTPATITDCVFVGNEARDCGGGMNCYMSSSPIVTGCTFEENLADYGGAVNIERSSEPVFTDCAFLTNQASVTGGGVYSSWESRPTFVACSFTGNDANHGGGMSTGEALLTDCTFSENYAEYNGGGLRHGGDITETLSLTRCSFSDNSAGDHGGGVHWYNAHSYVLTDCTFDRNEATYGGGAYSAYSAPPTSDCSLVGCTFSENIATYGGGMYYQTSGYPTLTGCTFVGNEATDAGGMTCFGTHPALTNCIIALSEAGTAFHCAGTTASAELVCCDVFGNAGGDWVDCIADQHGVNGNFSEDPLFCLFDNPDSLFSLHEGSPCLPESSPCGELVGALGQGCGPISPVARTSWGLIKAMFR